MKIAIVGSRSFSDYNLLKKSMNSFIKDSSISITHIVSGGAKGADSLAHQYANENNLQMIVFKPDWKKFGKRAGIVRNSDIIENADIILAFWDGLSSGTKNSIDKALKLNKKVIIKNFTP